MKLNAILRGAAFAATVMSAAVAYASKAEVDPGLESYSKAAGVSGNLSSVGSD